MVQVGGGGGPPPPPPNSETGPSLAGALGVEATNQDNDKREL